MLLVVKKAFAGKNRITRQVHPELAESAFVAGSRNVRKVAFTVSQTAKLFNGSRGGRIRRSTDAQSQHGLFESERELALG